MSKEGNNSTSSTIWSYIAGNNDTEISEGASTTKANTCKQQNQQKNKGTSIINNNMTHTNINQEAENIETYDLVPSYVSHRLENWDCPDDWAMVFSPSH